MQSYGVEIIFHIAFLPVIFTHNRHTYNTTGSNKMNDWALVDKELKNRRQVIHCRGTRAFCLRYALEHGIRATTELNVVVG